ncbi:MAG: RNA polymerase sigma factor [Acidobacteriota bacterium]
MQRKTELKGYKELEMDEQELMERIKDGDEAAFGKIVRAYKDRMVNFIWQLTGDYERAVELAQETFMRVYFKAKQYQPVAPFSSWIYTIAANLAKTDLKKKRKMPAVSFDEVQDFFIEEEASFDSPEKKDSIRILRRALNNLHPRYRIPVVLKDMEGFSQEEIAQIMMVPVGTIKARISRGRNYLRKELEKFSNKEDFFKEGEGENG